MARKLLDCAATGLLGMVMLANCMVLQLPMYDSVLVTVLFTMYLMFKNMEGCAWRVRFLCLLYFFVGLYTGYHLVNLWLMTVARSL